ncbi:MAG: hypothetical protein AAF802_28640 [Planctomycetota bacterium]
MSALEPTSVGLSRAIERRSDSQFDESTMLLALWSMQIDTLRDTLASQFAGARERQESLLKVGNAVSKVTAVHIQVQSQELSAVSSVLKKLRDVQSQLGRKLLSARKALAEVFRWADNREISLSPIELPVRFEISDWLRPGEAIRRNLTLIENYVQAVQTNSANNKRIRSLITNAPELDRIFADLKEYDHPHSIESLRDLVDVGTSLSIQLHSIQNDLQHFASRVRIIGEEIRIKSNELSAMRLDLIRNDTKRVVRAPNRKIRQLRRDLQVLENHQLRRELLDELLETLLHFEVLDELRNERGLAPGVDQQSLQSIDWDDVFVAAEVWSRNLHERLRKI